MTAADSWARLKAVFDAALDAPPASREALIAAAGLGAADEAELRSLLAHHADVTGGQPFLALPAAALQALGRDDPAARVGQRLGAWEVLRPLGAGGMGEVFEARRADGQYEGRAAVKLLKRGMDSVAVLQRFALERQALARLSHPQIARLLDAGASAEGLPYFVMEYVDGRPIDQALQGLGLEQRLAVFLQLTDAVAHAHRNLLVHRDLKPGNVLVDGEGRVKLLDFGIAKALDPLESFLAHDGSTTVGGQRPFTPHYASPEQVRGEPVSTATDIYSLGVLLYQMLTGTRPTGRKATTPAEAARSVLEEEPTRPSRLSPTEAVDPQWLRTRKRLAGDLDNILLKALEKDPARRYASVDALRADIEAFLGGRPVSARAASAGYVAAKWLGRHRAAAAAAALGGLGLLTGLLATLLQGRVALGLGAAGMAAGLVLALVQARRAQLARDDAAQARDAATRHLGELRQLANSLVFEVNDALAQGLVEGRRQLVRVAEQSLQRQAAYGQMSDAERVSLGWALARLARLEGHEYDSNTGDVRGALTHYDRALQVLEPLAPRQQSSGDWDAAMAATLEGRFAVLRQTRQPELAQAALARAAEHAGRAADLAPKDVRLHAHACTLLAHLADHTYPIVRYQGLLDLPAACHHAQAAWQRSQALVAWAGADPRALRTHAQVLRVRAGFLAIDGDLGQALAVDLEALAVLERAIALPGGASLRSSDFAQAAVRRAVTQRAAGLYDEAHATLLPALARAEGDLQGNVGDEFRQRQFVAVAQTLLDLHLHRRDEAGAAALHERLHLLLPRLAPEQVLDPLSRRAWQHAWTDSLQALCWARTGQLDRAQALVDRLGQWLSQGTLRLREHPNPLDTELEANIHIARAQLAAARQDEPAAAAASGDALERLGAMQALRDPTDAIEALRRWQLTVRLAQGLGAPGREAVVALAREQQAGLVARGLVAPERWRESQWLAAAG
jgi:hypothetical protein